MDCSVDHEQVRNLNFSLQTLTTNKTMFPGTMTENDIDRCDKTDFKTGSVRPLQARPSYSTARKMRAAMSHKFGRDFERGQLARQENLMLPGHFSGNPSVSTTVSQYMVSLRRTKVSSDCFLS